MQLIAALPNVISWFSASGTDYRIELQETLHRASRHMRSSSSDTDQPACLTAGHTSAAS